MPRKGNWRKSLAAKESRKNTKDKNMKADVGLVPTDGSGLVPTSVPLVVDGLVPTTMTSVSAGVGLVPTPVTAVAGLVPSPASTTVFTTRSESDITFDITYDTTTSDITSNITSDDTDIILQKSLTGPLSSVNELQMPSPFNAVFFRNGSFSQRDARFNKGTRDKQCLCNALVYLAMTFNKEDRTELDLDKVLILGDQLYKSTVDKLRKGKKLRNILLNFDEIPQLVETGEESYNVIRHEIYSGAAVDVNSLGLPTIHNAILDGLNESSSVLVLFGLVCSAVHFQSDLYFFFDSHSHGKDGLFSEEGFSVLAAFSNIDDLVCYLYAHYTSMFIDLESQFGLASFLYI